MLNGARHLTDEFPEYKERIEDLKAKDKHFKHLYDNYEKLDIEIHSIEQKNTVPDIYIEGLKKKRLLLKDELYAHLHNNMN